MFIELTSPDGTRKELVGLASIKRMFTNKMASLTTIHFTDGEVFEYKETYDEIRKLIFGDMATVEAGLDVVQRPPEKPVDKPKQFKSMSGRSVDACPDCSVSSAFGKARCTRDQCYYRPASVQS